MKNNKNKILMYAISNVMSEPEAISFVKILEPNEKYFLVKVSENPRARHVAKRKRFVIVRYPKDGELVTNGYALFTNKEELCDFRH